MCRKRNKKTDKKQKKNEKQKIRTTFHQTEEKNFMKKVQNWMLTFVPYDHRWLDSRNARDVLTVTDPTFHFHWNVCHFSDTVRFASVLWYHRHRTPPYIANSPVFWLWSPRPIPFDRDVWLRPFHRLVTNHFWSVRQKPFPIHLQISYWCN